MLVNVLLPHSQLTKGPYHYLLAYALYDFRLKYTYDEYFLPRTLLAMLSSLNPVPGELAKLQGKEESMSYVSMYELLENVLQHLGNERRSQGLKDGAQSTGEIILVIDAIDELQSYQQRANALKSLKRICELNKKDLGMRIRIVLLCRHDPDVESQVLRMDGWRRHAILDSLVQHDIETAVQYRIGQHFQRHIEGDSPEPAQWTAVVAEKSGVS